MIGVLAAAQAALTRANEELAARAAELSRTNSELERQIAERERAEDSLRQAQPMAAHGPLTGLWNDGVAVFRGVPYALPPVSARNFAPPPPVAA